MDRYLHEKLDYQIKSHLTATDYRHFLVECEALGLSQQSLLRMLVKKFFNEQAINELSTNPEHESSTSLALNLRHKDD